MNKLDKIQKNTKKLTHKTHLKGFSGLFLLFCILCITPVLAQVWDQEYIYDKFDDSSFNGGLWDSESSGTYASQGLIETGGYLEINSSSGSSGEEGNIFVYSNSFDKERIININIENYLYLVDDTSSNYGVVNFSVFGNALGSFSSNGEERKNYSINKNVTAGEDKWDVYINGVFNSQINASNSKIGSHVWRKNEANAWITGKARIYYVNYTYSNQNMNITLNYPNDNSINLSDTDINFETTLNTSINTFENISLYIDDTLNETEDISGTFNETIFTKSFSEIGNHNWSVYVCDNESNCKSSKTRDFEISYYKENELIYDSIAYETSETYFRLNLSSIYELSNFKLVYNGTNYSISNINTFGDIDIMNKSISLPLSPTPFSQSNVSFYWSFNLYNGSESIYYETTSRNQTISFINLQLCNGTYNIPALNFTLKDELTFVNINASKNSTTFQTTFSYWLDKGDTKKNYSYSVSNNSNNQFSFCIYPTDKTFYVDLDSIYSAIDYNERSYYLRNSSLTNSSSLINLLLLLDSEATKFNIDVKRGSSNFPDAIVTISKYEIGNGTYRNIGIRKTNSDGEFIEYLDLDSEYRFDITKNGIFYGSIEKQALCSSAPCELSLNIDESQGSVWDYYGDYFASDIVSSMDWNSTSKILTYSFLDITGLAQYFRLNVDQVRYNETSINICNNTLYSTSGSLTCNLTDYTGDFIAKGYVSRSPELIDKIKQIAISFLREELGLLGLFVCFGLILTITLAGAVISNGNPTTTIIMFGLGVFATKLMTLFPFSWVIVALIELIVVLLAKEIGT